MTTAKFVETTESPHTLNMATTIFLTLKMASVMFVEMLEELHRLRKATAMFIETLDKFKCAIRLILIMGMATTMFAETLDRYML
jgi:hypothetical protein